jgi:hypothetical protein
MNQAPPSRLCYVTPTFYRDIKQFSLLRRSLELFSPDVPHIAVVDTEDIGMFRERFAGGRSLEIVPTAEVLPRRLESTRCLWRSRRGRLIERIGGRYGLDRKFSGWKVQQIAKLEIVPQLPYDAVVFLDSDLTLCGRVNATDYFDQTRLILLETPAENYIDYAFEASRQHLMDGDLRQPASAFKYIHSPPRFLRRTAERLRDHLSRRYPNWHLKFLAESFPSEYDLLGYAARVLEQYDGYKVASLSPEHWYYGVFRLEHLSEQLDKCRKERGSRKFFLVQSNIIINEGLQPDEYLPILVKLIEELASGGVDAPVAQAPLVPE